MKRKYVCAFVFMLGVHTLLAQDIHFSQFNNTPMAINPALTGLFDGNYRLATNYKNQWSAITNPFSTSYSSFDMNIGKGKKTKGYLNAGLSFFSDKAGKSKMGTNAIGLNVSYNAKITKTGYLAAGIQSGYIQKSVNLNGLKWDDQYNGSDYDPNQPTSEARFGSNTVSTPDFAAGIAYTDQLNEDVKLEVGAAYFHLTKPSMGFAVKDALPRKLSTHAKCDYHIKNTNTLIVPTIIYLKQGSLMEMNVGGMVKYVLGLDSKYTGENIANSIAFGGLYRSRDAIVLMGSFDYKKYLTVGLSYDINVSKLTAVTSGRGGIEIAIVYRGVFTKAATASSIE